MLYTSSDSWPTQTARPLQQRKHKWSHCWTCSNMHYYHDFSMAACRTGLQLRAVFRHDLCLKRSDRAGIPNALWLHNLMLTFIPTDLRAGLHLIPNQGNTLFRCESQLPLVFIGIRWADQKAACIWANRAMISHQGHSPDNLHCWSQTKQRHIKVVFDS